ncbi:uncharacterized protein LOC135823755 [Sycon ciliatum]|uniref:uncharacterized protein LOC135823755 n=1 Tax=Sycon ciliatum TaxID=27933 RepID=UPI0031F66C88
MAQQILQLAVALLAFTAGCQATLTRRSIYLARARGALCLDGSPASYYMYRNVLSSTWVIHLETSQTLCIGPGMDECEYVANSSAGSSRTWSCVLPEIGASRLDDVGILVSSDTYRNPRFASANRVFIRHCSGDMFIGDRGIYNGLYFGGHNIVQAVIEDLVNSHELGNANEVLFGGASLGAITHARLIRQLLPNVRNLAVYTDGLGLRPFPLFNDFLPIVQDLAANGNASNITMGDLEDFPGFVGLVNSLQIFNPFVPDACRENGSEYNGLQCLDVTQGASFVPDDVALFMFASTWDTFFLVAAFGLDNYTCAVETGQLTDEQELYVRALGTANQNSFRYGVSRPFGTITSRYMANCYGNTFLEDDLFCVVANGRTPYSAMVAFVEAALSRQYVSDAIDDLPQDLSCSQYCGSPQCSWGNDTDLSNGTFSNDTMANETSTGFNDTMSNETSSGLGQAYCTGALDGYSREEFRVGRSCPYRTPFPEARSSFTPTVLSRYNVRSAVERSALCMDGSPASYYFQGNASSRNWVIHLQGSTLCSGAADCPALIAQGLGSSNGWACALPGLNDDGAYATVGLPVRNDSELNPAFIYWNKVYVRYCSGDQYLGQQPAATNPTGSGYNHLGHYILGAILLDLIQFHGLVNANTVFFGGSASGGVGVTAHIDGLRSILAAVRPFGPPALYGYVDGGWLRPAPGVDESLDVFMDPENSTFLGGFWGYVIGTVHNAYLDDSCFDALRNSSGSGIECVSASVVWPYLEVPMLMISSRWDVLDMLYRLGVQELACITDTQQVNRRQRDFLVRFGQQAAMTVADTFTQRPYDGVFFPTCFGSSHFDHPYELGVTPPCDDIDGTSAAGALYEWAQAVQFLDRQPPRLIGASLTGSLQCADNCNARLCQVGPRPDSTEFACNGYDASRFDFGLLFNGESCPRRGPCPAADMATTDDERYRANLACWSENFNGYQRVFERYAADECNGN